MDAKKPLLLIRVHIDTPNRDSISVGPVIVQGIDNKSAFVLQLPIYGQEPDGWPFDPVAFGLAVRSARTDRGWSQKTLGKKAQLTEQTVRGIERGRTASPLTRDLLIEALQDTAKSPQPERTTP